MKRFVLLLFVLLTVSVSAQDLRNSSYGFAGRLESDGTFRGSNGLSIGKLDNDCTVRGSNGLSIGKIEDKGTVRGSNGLTIGSASSIPKTWAAAAFFFYEFQ